MAEEKKQEQNSYAEQIAKALQSMKGKPLPTDFDELDTPLRADIVEKLHGKHKTPKES